MTLFGIRFKFHPLFVMIMFASVLTGYFFELAVLFGIVLIHELGHVAAATGYGWKIKELQFLPFGGVALVEQQGNVPIGEEIVVALAGPLQNGLMIGIAMALQTIGLWQEDWAQYFIKVNCMLALFNLLPILPLDGGKVIQALFGLTFSYYRSLQVGYWLSFILSLFMIGYAFVRADGLQLNLLMIGLFLLYSNWVGIRHIPYQFIRFLMNREQSVQRMLQQGGLAEPLVVRSDMELQEMLRLLMRDRHHLYFLINGTGKTQAVVPELRLIQQFFLRNLSMNDAKPPVFM